MLTRDYSYHIYRSLYSCLEVTETNVEATVPEVDEPAEPKTENLEEQTEPMITSGDEVVPPGLDLVIESSDAEDNERKRKRSPSKVTRRSWNGFTYLRVGWVGWCLDSTQENKFWRNFNHRNENSCTNSSTHHSSWTAAGIYFLRSKSLWISRGERRRRDSSARRFVIDEKRGTVAVIESTLQTFSDGSRPNCSSVVSHTTTRFRTIDWPTKSCRSMRPPMEINWRSPRQRSTPPRRKVTDEFCSWPSV